MNWEEALKRFIAMLWQWDDTHPSRWYAYYLNGIRQEDIPDLAKLLEMSILEGADEKAMGKILHWPGAEASSSPGEE